MIFLQAELQVLMERIKQRGLEFEKQIDPSYLKELVRLYNDFFFQYREAPLLVVGGRTTGLMMAAELARRGVAVRVVDRVRRGARRGRTRGVQRPGG